MRNAPAVVMHPEAGPRMECFVIEGSLPEQENARASDHDARASKNADRRALLAERVEAEIERIREARPHLSSRLDRASNLLLLQLASPPRQRPVKVRIAADGRRRFLVSSTSSGGVVYSVDPATYTCSCPDAHRRGVGCKHGLSCFILRRVGRTQRRGCSACDRGWVFLGEGIVDPESGEVAESINPVRCTRCGNGLSHAYVRHWLEGQRWHFAKSRPDNPHSYCLRGEASDHEAFERIVEFIREYGARYPWWGAVYEQLPLGEYCYWSMGAPLSETQLINRKSLEQVRQDQLTNKGGGGVVWPWLHGDIEAERAELRRQEAAQDELAEGT
jgi:hypothetical protein